MAATTTPSRPRTNKAALRDAVAALNAGNPEDYLALFRPDAELHGFPAGIDDVEALCRFHAAQGLDVVDAGGEAVQLRVGPEQREVVLGVARVERGDGVAQGGLVGPRAGGCG